MRHLEVLYCDDVREEINGKLMFIGTYIGDMLVSQIPVTLPKLVLYVTLVSDIKHPFEFIKLRAQYEGNVLAIVEVDKEVMDAYRPQNLDGKTKFFGTFFLVVSPFVIEKEGKLEIYAETESGEVKGRSLNIKLAAQQ